tara:strand:- start:2319 stop:3422 length:1104 start_codon:yes stop_codon:yes gene_type:complete
MKNIVFISTRSDEVGGAQTHVRDLSHNLIKSGFNVQVIVGGSSTVFTDQLNDLRIPTIRVASLKRQINIFRDLITMIRLYKILLDLQPSLVSLHSYKAGLLVRTLNIFIRLRFPIIYTAHGWSHLRTLPDYIKPMFYTLERILSSSCKYVITVCEADYKYALKHRFGLKSNLRCIRNAMPFIPKSNSLISNGNLNIITVARLDKPKDYLTIINALAVLKTKKWKYTIIGDGPQLSMLENHVNKLGLKDKITFLGRIKNVHNYLLQSNLFILSSFSEGLPRSLIEATRASLPIISSDVGGVSECVLEGINGFLFDPGDVNLLVGKLNKFIDNPYLIDIYSRASRSIYDERFDFNLLLSEHIKLYNEII